jgi:deazaflavin-dependent oxidoreductase (nitroreductase family)
MSIPGDMAAFNAEVAKAFRATKGAGPLPDPRLHPEGLLLLTTTGARSGERRTTPLGWLRLDGELVVMASNMGAPSHPGWHHNIVADPHVTVEIGAEEYPATARTATGAERARLWEGAVAEHPFYADHQASTDREIPVVVLERDA